MINKRLSLFFGLLFIFSTLQTTEEKNSKFNRPDGYWTKTANENRTDFFGTPTAGKSQREDWYAVSSYIGEFWCTVSNIGFFYVGLKYKCPELLFAGTASAVSHAIPKKWLHTIDLIGVAVAGSKLLREYQTVQTHPWLLGLIPVVATINASDAYLARNYGKTWPHVIWHLSSAMSAGLFLSYVK